MEKQEKLLIAASSFMVLAIPAVAWVAASQPATYLITSGSMEPSLTMRSTIRIQQHPYQNAAQVRRGDIVLFTLPGRGSSLAATSVKRVIGLPGDKIKLSGATVWINGHPLAHSLPHRVGKIALYQEQNDQASYPVQYGGNTTPAPAFSTTVPWGEFFCLGDNRDNALDSRYTGSIPFAAIVGKAITG